MNVLSIIFNLFRIVRQLSSQFSNSTQLEEEQEEEEEGNHKLLFKIPCSRFNN
jgi:hypothetical protein